MTAGCSMAHLTQSFAFRYWLPKQRALMSSYLALIWNTLDIAEQHSAESISRSLSANRVRWSVALDEPGVRLFARPVTTRAADKVYVLPNGTGILVGTIFARFQYSEGSERVDPSSWGDERVA